MIKKNSLIFVFNYFLEINFFFFFCRQPFALTWNQDTSFQDITRLKFLALASLVILSAT